MTPIPAHATPVRRKLSAQMDYTRNRMTPADGRANYLRFRLSPNSAVALAARVKRDGKEFIGDQRELYLLEEQPGEESPYARLLTDAMAGDGALFTREDAVEAAWAVVDTVLDTHHEVHRYQPGGWGPKQADALIAADGSWHNPTLVKTVKGRRRTKSPEGATP